MTNQERQKVGMVIGLISSAIGLILFFLLEIIKLIKVPSIIVEGFLVIGMFILSLSMIVFKDKSENKNDSPVIAEDTKHKLIVNEVTFNRSLGVPDRQVDLTKDMNEEELTKYLEREWNRGKYQAGKK